MDMKILRLIPLACLTFACGPASQELPTPTDQSGSRLLYRAVQAEGGAERFLHFVDQQTQEPCRLSFEQVDDKVLAYCFPAQTGNLVYLDPDCTQAAIQTSALDHNWVTAADFHGVSKPRGFKLGDRIPTQEQLYFSYGNSDCNQWGLSSSNQPIYQIAEEREQADWLSGEIQTDALSNQITMTSFVGHDGSRVRWGLWDNRSDLPCRPGTTNAGGRCVPQYDTNPIEIGGLLSEDCETRYVADYNVSRMVWIQSRGQRFYLTTPLDRDTKVAYTGHGACLVNDSFQLGRMTLYALEPYPVEEWPALTVEDGGSGAVRTTEASFEGQRATPEGEQPILQLFHTGREDVRCGPSWVDDTLRCVPEVGEFENWFFEVYVDNRCSTRGVSVQAGRQAPSVARVHRGVTPPTKGSLPIVEFFRVGRLSNSVGYSKNDYECTARALGDVYELTERVPATEFEPLSLIDRTNQ